MICILQQSAIFIDTNVYQVACSASIRLWHDAAYWMGELSCRYSFYPGWYLIIRVRNTTYFSFADEFETVPLNMGFLPKLHTLSSVIKLLVLSRKLPTIFHYIIQCWTDTMLLAFVSDLKRLSSETFNIDQLGINIVQRFVQLCIHTVERTGLSCRSKVSISHFHIQNWYSVQN